VTDAISKSIELGATTTSPHAVNFSTTLRQTTQTSPTRRFHQTWRACTFICWTSIVGELANPLGVGYPLALNEHGIGDSILNNRCVIRRVPRGSSGRLQRGRTSPSSNPNHHNPQTHSKPTLIPRTPHSIHQDALQHLHHRNHHGRHPRPNQRGKHRPRRRPPRKNLQ
jgi:hypothetical protein